MSASASASDATTSTGDGVLQIRPGEFGLPSIEPMCLAAVLDL